jgi:hypothetical protein
MPKKTSLSPLLYIVSETPEGPCKIGYATRLYHRLHSIQTGNSRQVTMASVWDCAERPIKQCERMLHQRFHRQAIRGEWFNLSVVEIETACLSIGMFKDGEGFDYSRKPTPLDTRLSWLIQ